MNLHSSKSAEIHKKIHEEYKDRLDKLEDMNHEEQEEPFERSSLHNAIYLHNLWFDQLSEGSEGSSSPLLVEILERRDSDLTTFKEWMNGFAKDAEGDGWAIWGWSSVLKTFVGFPIRNNSDEVPLGVTPILVIDCWEHSYMIDFENDFDTYLDRFWNALNWQIIEDRHQDLASAFGYNLK